MTKCKIFLAIFFLTTCLFLNGLFAWSQVESVWGKITGIERRGIWVSCFSEKKVLYSQDAIRQLIEFCQAKKINEIYLQVYRGGQAYYDSALGSKEKYEQVARVGAKDAIDILLAEAAKNNIKVFAWVNLLSVTSNKEADIIVKFGDSILTRDQYLRPSLRSKDRNELDKYYLRDEQLFLEPGDPRVVQYLLSVIEEIITRYPTLSGIHLDYLRYPNAIPSLPDSRFLEYGLVYGFGENNLARFTEATGLNPLAAKDKKDTALCWDNWKRQQISFLVEKIAELLKTKSKNLLLSCAVIAAPERAYSLFFQDWPFWLENGTVDYVVLMNYSADTRLAKEVIRSALAHRGRGKVYTGLGVFMMQDRPELFAEQCKIVTELSSDGVVFFSYDELSSFLAARETF